MPSETIFTDQTSVKCDGTGALGHPRVYLHLMSETGQITCPYCSRHFVLKGVHTDGVASQITGSPPPAEAKDHA